AMFFLIVPCFLIGSFCCYFNDTVKFFPVLAFAYPIHVCNDTATSLFYAAMTHIALYIYAYAVFLLFKSFFNIIQQTGLIFFNGQYVMGFLLYYFFCYFLLTTHRINGNDTIRQIQYLQQFGNGRYFITLVI